MIEPISPPDRAYSFKTNHYDVPRGEALIDINDVFKATAHADAPAV
jgi:hypothetical protein